MRVHTTKAPWFGALLCGLATLPLGCRKEPPPAPEGFCANDGVVSSRSLESVTQGNVNAEIVQKCGDCRNNTRSGAPEGAPCSAASVCAEACCDCPNSFTKSYRARVCEAGHCAGKRACELARTAIRPDVCEASAANTAAP